MQQALQLTKRFQEVFIDGKWVANTNFKEQLTDITLQEANTQIGSLNTIAKLTFHVNYYISGLIDFFETGTLEIKDKYSFDMPDIRSEKDWQHLNNTLISNSEKLATLIRSLTNEQLNNVFVDPKYGTYHRNIDAMIEHAYYHLGQLTLIKKLIREHAF